VPDPIISTQKFNGDILGPQFDLNRLRLPQDFQAAIAARPVRTTMQVRKPNRQEFIRVRSGSEWRFRTLTLQLKAVPEIYIVDVNLQEELSRELTASELVLACNIQGDSFLWPLRLPNAEGRRDSWAQSALSAAQRAEDAFVRLIPNMSLGAYDVIEAVDPRPEPEWPQGTMAELLTLAFRGQVIDSVEHPVVRQLRGQR